MVVTRVFAPVFGRFLAFFWILGMAVSLTPPRFLDFVTKSSQICKSWASGGILG